MEKLQKNDDIRRTTRIIQIDEMLRGGSYVRIASLVRKFGVSQRTVERDFERLRDDLNAPLEYDKSKNMYHYTDPTFSVPNVILTEGELFTVSVLLPLMEQYKNTPLESSFKNIMKKLVDFLPDTVSVNSSFLNQDISFISDPLPKIDENIFNMIFKAVKSRKVLSIIYQSSKSQQPKEKTFNAYKVICQKGNWYVFGFEHETCDFRIYSLARIQKAELQNDFFQIPDDFDIKKHIDLELGIWNNPGRFEEYEILFAKETSRYVLEREWHKDQIIEQQEDGTVLLKFKSNQSQMIYTWLLSFGNNAMVIKPQELRKKIRAECEKVAEKYMAK
ncbi:MAG: helix-turn-helix transcriptional regulator [Treponema sp.]